MSNYTPSLHVDAISYPCLNPNAGFVNLYYPRCMVGTCLRHNETRSLQWSHNERDDVSNHRRTDCLLNRLFRYRSKKTSKLLVTILCTGNSPVTGEFPAQKASNAENVSIWWRHHGYDTSRSAQLIHCITKREHSVTEALSSFRIVIWRYNYVALITQRFCGV